MNTFKQNNEFIFGHTSYLKIHLKSGKDFSGK